MNEQFSAKEAIEILTESLKLKLLQWETPDLKNLRESANPENIAELRIKYQDEAQKLPLDDFYRTVGIMFGCALMLKQAGKIKEYEDELWSDGETDLVGTLINMGYPAMAELIKQSLS